MCRRSHDLELRAPTVPERLCASSVTCCGAAVTFETFTGRATKPGITDAVAANATPLLVSFDSTHGVGRVGRGGEPVGTRLDVGHVDPLEGDAGPVDVAPAGRDAHRHRRRRGLVLLAERAEQVRLAVSGSGRLDPLRVDQAEADLLGGRHLDSSCWRRRARTASPRAGASGCGRPRSRRSSPGCARCLHGRRRHSCCRSAARRRVIVPFTGFRPTISSGPVPWLWT